MASNLAKSLNSFLSRNVLNLDEQKLSSMVEDYFLFDSEDDSDECDKCDDAFNCGKQKHYSSISKKINDWQ